MYTIVRIEHANGYGMFRASDPAANNGDYVKPDSIYSIGDSIETELMANKHRQYNTPCEDGINRKNDDFCAFKSMEHFNNVIIKEDLQYLLNNHPYKVLLLTVSKIKEGKDQVCYKKKHIISSQDISSLFK